MDFTFFGKPPMLGIIEIVKVTAIMGEDAELVLTFDTDENPLPCHKNGLHCK